MSSAADTFSRKVGTFLMEIKHESERVLLVVSLVDDELTERSMLTTGRKKLERRRINSNFSSSLFFATKRK